MIELHIIAIALAFVLQFIFSLIAMVYVFRRDWQMATFWLALSIWCGPR